MNNLDSVALVVGIVFLIALFGGEPDIADAIIERMGRKASD